VNVLVLVFSDVVDDVAFGPATEIAVELVGSVRSSREPGFCIAPEVVVTALRSSMVHCVVLELYEMSTSEELSVPATVVEGVAPVAFSEPRDHRSRP